MNLGLKDKLRQERGKCSSGDLHSYTRVLVSAIPLEFLAIRGSKNGSRWWQSLSPLVDPESLKG
jgi:hypothetical protein